MANGPIPYVDVIIADLLQANIAIPIIFATIVSIVNIVKAAGGSGPDLNQLADLIDAQIDLNDTDGKAIIADLRAQNQS